ncbi:TTF-type zinc finger protein with HAT dimerisation domain, partial [Striga hermonthica]
FVDICGFVRHRFFDLVHVCDTKAITLKDAIFSTLSRHNLDIQNIRGQGYDGASNMRGEFNGLHALIAKECPYAYCVHFLAHRLQLALVGTSKEVIPVYHFFTTLNFIINVV